MLQSLASRASPGPGNEVALKNANVRVEGARAFVTVGGGLVWRIDDGDPAVYVKTDEGWRFDSMMKAGEACRVAGALG